MERINFREVGDLGKTLQKSAQFIRQNFIAVFKPALLIVIVPLIIGSVITGIGMSSVYSNLGATIANPDQLPNPLSYMGALLPGYLLTAISYMLFYIICVAYIKQYVNGVEEINQNSILQEVKNNFIKVFFGGILIAIISYIGIFLCLVPGIYLAVVFSHLFIIAIVENKRFGESFSKSFSLIKGKWWDSFLLYLVSTFIIMGISFIMILPMYIVMFAGMFKNIKSNDPEVMLEGMSVIGWLMPIYMAVYLIIILITATIQSVNYYSLVETKEGIGEKSAIESIGN